MISKNVEKIIDNCLESVLPYVDEMIVVDTGSSDGTIQAIRKNGKAHKVATKILHFNQELYPKAFLRDVPETWRGKLPGPYTGEWMLADFGAARQLGWKQIQTDYTIWLDSDDVLENGQNLPLLLKDMKNRNVDVAFLNYDYAADDLGNVTCRLLRERIVSMKSNSRWIQPVHEILSFSGRLEAFPDIINVRHCRHEYKEPTFQRYRNLKILMKWFEDCGEKPDPRMLFYLGIEKRLIPFLKNEAVAHFVQYCSISNWDEERGVAHQLAGVILEESGRYEEALAEYAQAAMEFRWSPDPMFGAARVAYFKKDWAKCAEWSERGFQILENEKDHQALMHYDPLDRNYRSYVFYGAALVNLGRYKEAQQACLQGLKVNPQDPHLKGNLEFSEKRLASA